MCLPPHVGRLPNRPQTMCRKTHDWRPIVIFPVQDDFVWKTRLGWRRSCLQHVFTPPPPDPNLPSLVDVGLGVRHSCPATPLVFLPPLMSPFCELSHLPGPHIFPVPISVFHLPVRSSETDNFANERADVTSLINEALSTRVPMGNAFNTFSRSISSRCSFGGRDLGLACLPG